MTFDSRHLIPGCLITDVRLLDTWLQHQFRTPDSKTHDSKTGVSYPKSGHPISRHMIPISIPDTWFPDTWFPHRFQTHDSGHLITDTWFWTPYSRHLIPNIWWHVITRPTLDTWFHDLWLQNHIWDTWFRTGDFKNMVGAQSYEYSGGSNTAERPHTRQYVLVQKKVG